MDLFSCRNCIQNPCNGLYLGKGQGFCLQHNSVLINPDITTCKYLHRKDLPFFHVSEGIQEHAAEFAEFYGMVDLYERKHIPRTRYSEKYYWETGHFDPLVHIIAQYHRLARPFEDEEPEATGTKWRYIQTFAGTVDGSRTFVHTCLVRRYTENCGSWKAAYRLTLAFLQELDKEPCITNDMLYNNNSHNDFEELREQAMYEIIFARFSGIQEFGWHASLEDLVWAPSDLAESLLDADWKNLWLTLKEKKIEWENKVIELAKRENIYYPERESKPHDRF